MPDPRLGEKACAFVALTPGQSLTLEEVRAYLLGRGVAKYKLPERLEIRNRLSVTATGKLHKASLTG